MNDPEHGLTVPSGEAARIFDLEATAFNAGTSFRTQEQIAGMRDVTVEGPHDPLDRLVYVCRNLAARAIRSFHA